MAFLKKYYETKWGFRETKWGFFYETKWGYL